MNVKLSFVRLVGASILLACSVSGPAFAADKAPDKGDFILKFEKPDKPELNEVHQELAKNEDLPELTAEINRVLSLPSNIPIVFKSCGQVNAFYNPNSRSIAMCYELVQSFAEQFGQGHPERGAGEDAIVGATAFIMLHEVGHSLIHNLDVPVTGKEEDAVDDLAALVSLEFDAEGQGAVVSIIESFASLANGEVQAGQMAFHDEHSLNAQRMYSMMCVLYGSNPEQFKGMVADDLLPESRAARCPAEFQQKSKSWEKLLSRHLKD